MVDIGIVDSRSDFENKCFDGFPAFVIGEKYFKLKTFWEWAHCMDSTSIDLTQTKLNDGNFSTDNSLV